MTKPGSISQEDWDKAFYWMDDGGFISGFYSDHDENALQRTIARAIMAAKAEAVEKCAAFSDHAADLWEMEGEYERASEFRDLSAAIRNRDTV